MSTVAEVTKQLYQAAGIEMQDEGLHEGQQHAAHATAAPLQQADGSEDETLHSEQEEDEEEELNLKFFGIRQALPIPEGDPDWDSGPPETAEEYLRRVRAEAAACPRVVRVEFDAEAHAAKQRARAAAHQAERDSDGEDRHASHAATIHALHASEDQAVTAGQHAVAAMDAELCGGQAVLDKQQQRQVAGEPPHAKAACTLEHTGQPAVQSHGMPPRVAGYISRLLAAGTLQEGPDWAQPAYMWVRQLVADFRSMRQWLMQASAKHAAELQRSAKLPPVHDEMAWDQICFGHSNLGLSSARVHVRSSASTAASRVSTTRTGNKQARKRQLSTQTANQQEQLQQVTGHMAGDDSNDSMQGHLHPPGHNVQQQQQQQQQGSTGGMDHEGITDGTGCNSHGNAEGLQGQVDQGHQQHNGGVSPGRQSEGSHHSGHSDTSMDQIAMPVLSTVLCIDQVAVGTLLQRMVNRMVSSSSPLNEPEAQWLFALVAMLEKPAHSDVVAALRSLTRWLAQMRSGLADAGDPQLPRINTLAVVTGAYFGQDEKLVRWVADMDLP